ncbi:protein-disulfide reductase DsbD family protein [Pseudofulvibacter geojedonensis]|uniref:protein-disulfide reductase DsbD family protein n=1 Tax=Pseudofulvibacter geojedonensis TaxID=1123758 RepID=UPI00366BF641
MQAQIFKPVKWTGEVEKLSETEFNLIYKAKIEDHWHLYSQTLPEGGALPTEFFYDEEALNKKFEIISKKAAESKTITKFDKVFEMDLTFFDNEATLVQKIKLLDPTLKSIEGEVSYQACDDEKCMFESEKIKFDLSTAKLIESKNDTYLLLSKAESKKVSVKEKEINESKKETEEEEESLHQEEEVDNEEEEKTSTLGVFILGFLGGLAALFMPCIFPMIPMTVSFFTKQSKSKGEGIKKSIIYGLSIIFIYVALGMIITMIFGVSALNEFSTNPWVNIAFFILFIIFALSFFGAFEITLPSSWVNAADKNSDKGGLVGIFFMAFTLALVSFSCTGPIIGSLLVKAGESGDLFGPAMGMLGFAIALALPFTLFAMFPGWLNSMPKSGGWLNSVKVVLGFLELAFAFKFLSNADLVWQLHILEREMFLAIWIAIFIATILYLMGKIQMPHDSPVERLSVTRLMFVLVFSTFVVYMIPGLWGAPLKILSGLTPPKVYSEAPYGLETTDAVDLSSDILKQKHTKIGANGIPVFLDYDSANKYAKKVNKPLFIDFTGHACANCRKMEDNVWSDPRVKDLLKNDVVVVSLYVDERKKLDKKDYFHSEALDKEVTTTGLKWMDFSVKHFKANSQPYYAIVDSELNRMNKPQGADFDADSYYKWLRKGVVKYKKKYKKK